MVITEPGIYDIPAQDYRSDPCETPSLSASIAKVMNDKSPAHAREAHPRLNENFVEEQKDIFDLGHAAHNMVLRQNFWREEIAVIDSASRATKKWKEESAAAREAGQIPLKKGDYERLEQMVTVLESHPQASKAFVNGKPERTLIWQDRETGIWCRCRPDWTPDDFKVWPDYKTTADARPDHFRPDDRAAFPASVHSE